MMYHRLENLTAMNGDQLVAAFAAIPAGVTWLDLSRNSLHNITGAQLEAAFAAIPASVTSLDLSGNGFHIKTGAELAAAFAAIPASVTSLNLSWNHFHNKTDAELAAMAGSLSHITTVSLSLPEIEAMTVGQRRALRTIFPRVKTKDIILLDAGGNHLPAGRENRAVSLLGFGPREVPSLKALSALSVIQNPGPAPLDPSTVPVECSRYLQSF